MIVQCPACKITYTVADTLVKTEKPTFRCSRCKHIFALTGVTELNKAEEPSSDEIPPDPEERELSFSFEAKKKPKELPSDNDSAEPELSFNSVHSVEQRDESWSWTSTPAQEEHSKTSLEAGPEGIQTDFSPATPQKPAFDQNWWVAGGRQNVNLNAAELSTAPCLTLAALLVLFFSMVTLVYSSQPAYLDAFLKAIPGLGPSVFKNNHLKDGISVQSVTARAQTIRGNREVFTISGLALNRNTVSVRGLRLEGYIYNADGKELARQVIWVGSPISARIIRDVEPKELSILQELAPQKRFEILPEQSAPFIIVFPKPAKEISSFGYRVLSAEEVS
ncbi:MAG: zinc-ribbon domain-containing protein [Candidatus Binatia bacterium]